jgi:hypothetical protein
MMGILIDVGMEIAGAAADAYQFASQGSFYTSGDDPIDGAWGAMVGDGYDTGLPVHNLEKILNNAFGQMASMIGNEGQATIIREGSQPFSNWAAGFADEFEDRYDGDWTEVRGILRSEIGVEKFNATHIIWNGGWQQVVASTFDTDRVIGGLFKDAGVRAHGVYRDVVDNPHANRSHGTTTYTIDDIIDPSTITRYADDAFEDMFGTTDRHILDPIPGPQTMFHSQFGDVMDIDVERALREGGYKDDGFSSDDLYNRPGGSTIHSAESELFREMSIKYGRTTVINAVLKRL